MEYGNDGISQKGDGGEAGFGGLLERTAAHARGVLESIQALAGTTACKAVQIRELKKFAVADGCWIEDVALLGTFSDRGSENEVYINKDNRTVYKLNVFVKPNEQSQACLGFAMARKGARSERFPLFRR